MNRFLFFAISIFVCYSGTLAQNTYYYKLSRMIHGDIPSTEVTGGQFITFLNDICFESNKSGYSVGNGTLKLNNQAVGSYKTYEGKSYWGEDATFRFKYDLSVLNVVLDNGDVYVYKRATAPANITTCSLIREPEPSSGGGGGSGYTPPVYPVQSTYPQGGYGGGGTTTDPGGGGTTPVRPERPKKEKVRRTCSACNGKGTYEKNGGAVSFGTAKYKIRCNVCGYEYWNTQTHSHPSCPTCHGKGYIEEWM